MKLALRISLITSLLFFDCYSFGYQSPRYVKLAHEITGKTAKELKAQKKLLLVGTGGHRLYQWDHNKQARSIASAEQLSQYAGGDKIYEIYNATNWDSIQAVSTTIDSLECGLGGVEIHTSPVQLLKNQWNHFIATHGPEEKFLQFSSSEGSLHVYNALLTSPKSMQQRIISLAIAPTLIIPQKLCFQSYNYISKRDFVTHLNVKEKMKYGSELQILEPHLNANFWDHEFLSPIFKDSIERHVIDYIESCKDKK